MEDRKTKPGKLESALGGLQSGVTLGFDDELAGVSGALGGKSGGDSRGFWDLYKEARDNARKEQAAQAAANPISHKVGGLASVALSGPAALATKLPLIAALGGAHGLGHSKADLTEGEIGQAALDTARAATTSVLLGGVAPMVANKLGGKVLRSPESQSILRAKSAELGEKAPILAASGARTGQMVLSPDAQKELVRRLTKIEGTPLPFAGEMIQATKSYKPF